MDPNNPYVAPLSVTADPLAGADAVGLYEQTLAPAGVRAAGIAAMIAGFATLLATLQTAAVYRMNATLAAFVALQLAVAVGHFTASRGVLRARGWAAVVGVAACAVGGLTSVIVLLMVSFVGMITGLTAVATFLLLVTNFGPIWRMDQARRRLAKLDAGEAPPR